MTIHNTVREPFHYLNVESIVIRQVASSGTEGLKPRVVAEVREIIGLPSDPLPERVRTWVHQLCLRRTAPTAALQMFRGKLAEAIDLASLPGREK